MQKEWRHFIQRVDYTSSPARCAFKKASAPWQNERALVLRFAYSFRNGARRLRPEDPIAVALGGRIPNEGVCVLVSGA